MKSGDTFICLGDVGNPVYIDRLAKKYELLKLDLWKQFEYNRDAYTETKSEFVSKYTQEAKALYWSRYY